MNTENEIPSKPEIHNEDSGGWCLTNLFRARRWTIQRVVGASDHVDDTVIFIRDHWKNLISNASLGANDIFKKR